MLWPKATSPGSQPRNGARALVRACDERVGATGRLVRRADVRVVSRRYCEIASITSSGHCVPPGPSKKASAPVERRVAGAHRGDVERASRSRHVPGVGRRRDQRRADEAVPLPCPQGRDPQERIPAAGSPPSAGQIPEGVRFRGRNPRASLDLPRVRRRRRQRRAHEAVPLGLREQLGDRLVVGLRVERDVGLERDLDEREAAVRLAPRDRPARGTARGQRDACPDAVIAEARQRAAGQPGEEEVLGRPRRLLRPGEDTAAAIATRVPGWSSETA